MLRGDLMFAAAAGALLLGLGLASPVFGVGFMAAAACVAVIFMWPILGLAAMILTGTALQVLGSEHLTGLPMSLGKAAGILTLTAWAARSVAWRVPLTYSAQLLPLLGFATLLGLSTAMARDGAVALEGLFRYAQLFLLFFMIGGIAGERRSTLDLACIAVTACLALSSMIGLAEFFLPALSLESDDPSLALGTIGAIIDRDSIEGVEIKRITGGLSDSNWYAYTVVSFLPLNLYLLHRFRGTLARLTVLGVVGLQSIGIVLSLTRSALIAGAVGVIVLVVRRRLPLAPVIGLIIMAAIAIVLLNPPGLQRLFSTEYAESGSTPLRAALLEGGVALMRDRPLLGYGYSQYGPAFMRWLDDQHPGDAVEQWAADIQRRVNAGDEALENVMPHNTMLQIGVEYGLFGLAAFGLFLGGMVRDLAVGRRFGSKEDALLADCLLAGFWTFAVCTVFGHLAFLKVVWILGGLAAALRRVALESLASTGSQRRPEPAPAT